MSQENHDVYLIGQLVEMPPIPKSKFSDSEMIIGRESLFLEKTEYYRVTLNWQDTMKITNHGHIGMTLAIYADLRVRKNIEIIAEKIDFCSSSHGKHPHILHDELVRNYALQTFNTLCFDPAVYVVH